MTLPNRSQQVGLVILLAVLAGWVLARVLP